MGPMGPTGPIAPPPTAYGELYLSSDSTETTFSFRTPAISSPITTANTALLTSTVLDTAGVSRGTAVSVSSSSITVDEDGVYVVRFNATLENQNDLNCIFMGFVDSGCGPTYIPSLYCEEELFIKSCFIKTVLGYSTLSMSSILKLSSGDVVTIRIGKRVAGLASIDVYGATFNLHKIDD
jgi:hypothetical protein